MKKHFIGLTTEQFMALHSFLDEICSLDSIISWNQKELDGQVTESKSGPDSKFSTQEKLYMSILRLRRGYTIKSLAVLLSTPDRTIKETQIRRIFTTYIQLMFKVFRDMQDVMFPTRGKLKRYLPKVFKTLKDVRCVVDCKSLGLKPLVIMQDREIPIHLISIPTHSNALLQLHQMEVHVFCQIFLKVT